MLVQLFPIEDEISFVYQVVDKSLITSFSSEDAHKDASNTFNLNYIWKRHIYRFTSTVIVSVFYKLELKLTHFTGLEIYDGPGIKSKKLKFYSNIISLSTNQAFCVMFLNASSQERNRISYKILNLMYLATENTIVNIYLSGKETKVLPACTPQLYTLLKYPNKNAFQ